MNIHTHKRFTTWFDETLWTQTCVNSGLRHGVYDHKKDDKWSDKTNFIAKSHEEAQNKADELNKKLKNPFKW